MAEHLPGAEPYLRGQIFIVPEFVKVSKFCLLTINNPELLSNRRKNSLACGRTFLST